MKCGTCKFWEADPEKPSLGHCHRYAPKPAPRPEIVHRVEGDKSMNTLWPRTLDEDWCGEWSAQVEVE
jgi:hypothetical protein